jgi:pyrroline-5-carboxylate reductase
MQIQFIWCGKMWEVILQNLLEIEKSENIYIETKTLVTKNNLKLKYWVNIWINKNAEITFLLMKPQQFSEMDFEKFWKNNVVFSFMAWVKVENISKKIATNEVIRAMPNTPMLVWKWVIWYFYKNILDKNYINYFESIFKKSSKLIKCETEDKIDKITALSGSWPAYYYFITEILQQKAIEFWFSEIESEVIANNTFIWASELLEKSWKKIEILRKDITSKWGTTEKAIKTFKENSLGEKFMEWIEGAYNRAKNITN